MNREPDRYYVPHSSYWPIVAATALALTTFGFARYLTGSVAGTLIMSSGVTLLAVMFIGWFGRVVNENLSGRYNRQVDRTFRKGMGWFIFSEVMFFGAFFGALFYTRLLAVPWLGGAGTGEATHLVLWPQFIAQWPLLKLPDPSRFTEARAAMPPQGIPAFNTLILLTSSLFVTWAHWGIKRGRRVWLIAGLIVTLALGVLFLTLQAYEYLHAYRELNLKLSSGVYGSTFFLLTGFHGAHVTIGVVMLSVMLLRALSGHFDRTDHFAFEASSWYWHFVDVIWLCLFLFVYWL